MPSCELKQPVPEPKQDLARAYKAAVDRERSFLYNPLIPLLQSKKTVSFDMDLLNSCEPGINKFVAECHDILKIQVWSSLVALEDVDALRQSKDVSQANLLHASVVSFYEKCTAFKRECPVAPAKGQQKPGIPLSIDLHSNARLIKGLCLNLSKTKSLTELTLCGISLSKDSIANLGNGLFQASSLKILRINFCI